MNNKLQALLDDYKKDINILYVEDCPNTIRSMTNILSKYFINIDTALNGKIGLDMIKDNDKGFHYDVVLTDLDMPVLDGISMIKEIRKFNKEIYIVVFSVHNDPEYFIETINIGIDGYILKPFKVQQFIDIMIKFIEHLENLPKVSNTIQEKVSNNGNLEIKLLDDYFWDKDKLILVHNGEKIKLTKNETKLFECLSHSVTYTHSANELGSFIFEDYNCDDNSKLRNLLAKLKHKIGLSLVDSAYGIGYKLKTF